MPLREDPVRYGAENHGIFMIIKAKRGYAWLMIIRFTNWKTKAIYRLDFGSLQRAVGRKDIGGRNVDDFYFVDQWLETDRYLFIRLTKGYDSPNARKAKSVSLYSLIYDKTSGNFFSLPHEADKVLLHYH